MLSSIKHFYLYLFLISFSRANVPRYDAAYSRPFLSKMFFYYPAHETLDRIIKAVFKRQKGAYINFTHYDIEHARDQEVRKVFGLHGNNIFKALPLQCKDIATSISQRTACINDSEFCYQKFIEPLRLLWGTGVNHLYAPHALAQLVRQDAYKAARFIRVMKNAGMCIVVADQTQSNIQELFKNCCIVNSDKRSSREIAQECIALMGNQYATVFLAGAKSRLLAPYLLEHNCFVFDCGAFDELIENNLFKKLKGLVHTDIYVLFTAAILEHRKQERQAEYEKSITMLNSFWIEPHVVEACVAGPTFFDEYVHHICYTQSNKPVRNKGVNEIRSIRTGLEHYTFDDKDMIVKLTGRYFLKNESFLRLIESNPEIDGFITLDAMTHFAFTGCFALRYKYFKELITNINLVDIERYWIDFERVVVDYMRIIEQEKKANIMYVDELHIQALVDNRLLSHW